MHGLRATRKCSKLLALASLHRHNDCMHYSDLHLSTQLGLTLLVLVLWTGLLMRAVVYFRLENAGIRPLYPDSWNVGQCRTLERFRLLIGLGLVPLWTVYVFIVPSASTKWSFGYLQVISLIAMLSVTYAWAVLLAARNWKRLDAFPRSFLVIITFLVLWWGTAFSAIGWMLAEASTPTRVHMFSGVYAAREMPHLTGQQNI
jgi:hypothetical protein